jgi:multiple sugar transport system ATP-binding protein
MRGFVMAEVALSDVSKRFGAVTALDRVTMTIPSGAFVVLLGPTGAGKTTTLRVISGLDRPDAGDVRIDGRSVLGDTPAQRDVAMVFQQYSLYPHLTVRDNLAFPLRSPMIAMPEDKIAARVAEVAEVLRIPHKLDNKATELSGGEMQRVSIGRALVRQPRIYLMDEPLSSLDAKLRADLRIELKRIHSDLGATFLYVTHDQIEAMTMATHIGVLDEGRLVQFGTPREVYERPVSTYVASRLGQPRLTLLPAGAFGEAAVPPAGATQIGLRPEHIAQGGGVAAEITRVEHLGDQTRLHLGFGAHKIVTLAEPGRHHAAGDQLQIRPRNPLWFDAAGNRL